MFGECRCIGDISQRKKHEHFQRQISDTQESIPLDVRVAAVVSVLESSRRLDSFGLTDIILAGFMFSQITAFELESKVLFGKDLVYFPTKAKNHGPTCRYVHCPLV